MAIADFGGKVNGKPIELVYADHQNKADIAASRAREWIDRDGVDVLIGGTNSATALSTNQVAGEKKIPYINIGAGADNLTNEQCTPYTVHYAYDTTALAKGTGSAVTKQGGKTWFFLTADYAFGKALEKNTSDVVKANGGQVLGAVRHPLSASDFSSFLLQAQASKAQILGLANAGGDTINSIKAAKEFGITKTMKLAALLMFIDGHPQPRARNHARSGADRQLVLEQERHHAQVGAALLRQDEEDAVEPAGRRLLGRSRPI